MILFNYGLVLKFVNENDERKSVVPESPPSDSVLITILPSPDVEVLSKSAT